MKVSRPRKAHVRDGKPVKEHMVSVEVADPVAARSDVMEGVAGQAQTDPFGTTDSIYTKEGMESTMSHFVDLYTGEPDPAVRQSIENISDDYRDNLRMYDPWKGMDVSRPVPRSVARYASRDAATQLENLGSFHGASKQTKQSASELAHKLRSQLHDDFLNSLERGDKLTIPADVPLTTTHPSKRDRTGRTQTVTVFDAHTDDGMVTWVGSGGYWNSVKVEDIV